MYDKPEIMISCEDPSTTTSATAICASSSETANTPAGISRKQIDTSPLNVV